MQFDRKSKFDCIKQTRLQRYKTTDRFRSRIKDNYTDQKSSRSGSGSRKSVLVISPKLKLKKE